jgi:hypothetical protein
VTAPINWDSFRGRATFILGEDKNAGKTTFLKYALGCLRERGMTVAYMSVGVDGEMLDLVSGASKPLITAEPGDNLVTAESAAAASDAEFEVLEVFPERTVLGRLELLRAKSAGRVELIGPETNRALCAILRHVRAAETADAVLVDGAVDRVTQVSASSGSGYVLALMVNRNSLERAARRVRLAVLLDGLPVLGTGEVPHGCVEIDGALTSSKLGTLPGKREKLVLEDFTRVFLDYREMLRLCGDRRVVFRGGFELMFFVVVLDGVERREFLDSLGPEAAGARFVFSPGDFDAGQVTR